MREPLHPNTPKEVGRLLPGVPESDWRIFSDWCAKVSRPDLPPETSTVALFIAAQAKLGIARSTLNRRLAAIRLIHVGAKVVSPHDALAVAKVMRTVRRAWKRPIAQMSPALDADHTPARPQDIDILIANSKTDQEGRGQVVAIPPVPRSPYCPKQSVSDWMVAAAIESGPAFARLHRGDRVGSSRLTDQSVALIIKALAAKVGLDASRYAGHSLRSGFLTSAAQNRASIFKLADQSRHKPVDVLRECVRNEDSFDDHAADGLLQATAVAVDAQRARKRRRI